MLVKKAINNNVVSCIDGSGQEVIAMGRGLGFQLRPGSELNEAQAEKLFRMETQKETDRLKDLLATLPTEQVELCTRIIAYATETLGNRLNANVYITLTDHVCFAIRRLKAGASFQNVLLTEVRIFYPREYAVGKFALRLLRESLGIAFPDDEAASIALHLVNAEYDNAFSDTMHSTQALHDILALLHGWPGIALTEGSLDYDEFIVHLKFLVLRVFGTEREPRREESFVQLIRESYPCELGCARRIAVYLEQQSGRPLTGEQIAYLALHIRLANRAAEQ